MESQRFARIRQVSKGFHISQGSPAILGIPQDSLENTENRSLDDPIVCIFVSSWETNVKNEGQGMPNRCQSATKGRQNACVSRAPFGEPKGSEIRQNASPKAFFPYLFAPFFHVPFCIHFWSNKLCNDWYQSLKYKRFASTGARFSQTRFFH